LKAIILGYLKGENGVHRLVRISPLTVMPSVIPLLHPFMCIADSIEIDINPRDYDFAIQWCGTKCKVETSSIISYQPTNVLKHVRNKITDSVPCKWCYDLSCTKLS
jgi:protein subunit release factor B